jgi:hypothetical protein
VFLFRPAGSRDGGRRWGKFSIDASSYPSKISLVYADMSSESSQRLRTGFISSSCPEGIRLWWEEAGEGSTQLRAADSSTTEGGLAVYANLYFGVARIYTTVCDAHLKLEVKCDLKSPRDGGGGDPFLLFSRRFYELFLVFWGKCFICGALVPV